MTLKIHAKTSHGQQVSFELQPNDTITTLTETLQKLINIPQSSQKIILKGKQLPQSGTIAQSGIKDGDSVIVLSKRNKPAPLPLDTTPEPDSSSIRKAIAKSKGVDEKDLEDEEDDEPEYKSQLQDLVNSLFGNFAFPAVPAPPIPAANNANNLNNINNANPPPEAIAQLTDMGFTEAQARRALILNRMSIQRATDWLLEHGEEEEGEENNNNNEPAQQQPASSSQGEMVGGGGQVPIPILGRVINDTDGLTAEQRLLEMGFQSEEVTRALRATGNHYDAALQMLLGETDEDDHAIDEDSPIVRAIFSNPVVGAGLTNPRVMQAFRAMVENPASVANYISDPEVGPLILQVHAILQTLAPSALPGSPGPNPSSTP